MIVLRSPIDEKKMKNAIVLVHEGTPTESSVWSKIKCFLFKTEIFQNN